MVAVVQASGDDGVDSGCSSRDGEKGSYSGCILEEKVTGLSRLNVEC